MNARQHMERVQSLGCIICVALEGWGPTPAEVHHILSTDTNQRIDDYHTIPLCMPHHRGNRDDSMITSRHTGQRRQFEQRYLPEMLLLQLVRRSLELKWPHLYARGEEEQ